MWRRVVCRFDRGLRQLLLDILFVLVFIKAILAQLSLQLLFFQDNWVVHEVLFIMLNNDTRSLQHVPSVINSPSQVRFLAGAAFGRCLVILVHVLVLVLTIATGSHY